MSNGITEFKSCFTLNNMENQPFPQEMMWILLPDLDLKHIIRFPGSPILPHD
jgi:hypothetical protein